MPSTQPKAKRERLNFRLAPEQKLLIERAATTACQSVSEFAVSRLVREAQNVMQEQELLILSNRDRDLFLSLLESPPEPNEALKRGAKLYKRQCVRAKRHD